MTTPRKHLHVSRAIAWVINASWCVFDLHVFAYHDEENCNLKAINRPLFANQ